MEKESLDYQTKLKREEAQLRKVEASIQSLKDQREREKKSIEMLLTTKEKICPLCGQELTEKHAKTIKNEKEELNTQITEQIKKLEDKRNAISKNITEIEVWQQKLAEEEKQIIQLQNLVNTMKSLEDDKQTLETKIQTTKEEINTTLNDMRKEMVDKILPQIKENPRLLDALNKPKFSMPYCNLT